MEKLAPIKKKNAGCLCCKGLGHELELDAVLYMGFGGWTVFKNGQLFYEGDPNDEWENFKTLNDIEQDAAKEPNEDWRAQCNAPLHDETYQRQDGKWLLVEEGQGFA